MSILTSSFAALGAFFAEANPSLQGQRLYTRASGTDGPEKQAEALAVLDKQIFRLIGKSITLAA
jgi:citrate synthase